MILPLSREDAERRAAQLSAVADPTRLRLMSLVLTHPAGEVSVGQLAAELDQSHTAICQHLRRLCDAELLTRERRESFSYYRPTHHAVAQLATLLGVQVPERGLAREPASVSVARIRSRSPTRSSAPPMW